MRAPSALPPRPPCAAATALPESAAALASAAPATRSSSPPPLFSGQQQSALQLSLLHDFCQDGCIFYFKCQPCCMLALWRSRAALQSCVRYGKLKAAVPHRCGVRRTRARPTCNEAFSSSLSAGSCSSYRKAYCFRNLPGCRAPDRLSKRGSRVSLQQTGGCDTNRPKVPGHLLGSEFSEGRPSCGCVEPREEPEDCTSL